MTLQGAIQQLQDMRSDDNFPFYYKSAIDKVIETILTDAQEVRRGRWETVVREVRNEHGVMLGIEECRECSECHNKPLYSKWHNPMETEWCPWCGASMEEE